MYVNVIYTFKYINIVCNLSLCVYIYGYSFYKSSSSSGNGIAAAASISAWYLATSFMSMVASGGLKAGASTNWTLLLPESFLASQIKAFRNYN